MSREWVAPLQKPSNRIENFNLCIYLNDLLPGIQMHKFDFVCIFFCRTHDKCHFLNLLNRIFCALEKCPTIKESNDRLLFLISFVRPLIDTPLKFCKISIDFNSMQKNYFPLASACYWLRRFVFTEYHLLFSLIIVFSLYANFKK